MRVLLTIVLACSKTGSGKTAAYVLPILQSVLKRKLSSSFKPCISALILAPTRELAGQITKVIESLAAYCSQDVRAENITRKEDDKVQRARLATLPDIIVATPGRVVMNLNSSSLSLEDLAHLVIDEADLILSYDYEQDLETISKAMPQGIQTFLMSATLRTDVDTLKGLFCRDPMVLKLEEEKDIDTLSQYVVRCAEDEKFLLVYAMFMLQLIKGKTIVFVADIDRCYRLKLFLEQFGIKSCVLNSELPVNSRIHVVDEFNKNVYNIIIATDEHEVSGGEYPEGESAIKDRTGKEHAIEDDEVNGSAHANGKGNGNNKPYPLTSNDSADDIERPRKKKKAARRDKDYGVSRGIDFKNVACVLNFDLPTSSKSYTHRIGRTARAGKGGMAISFVIPKELYRKHKYTSIPSTEHDEEVLAKIAARQSKKGSKVQPYNFDMKRLDGFRYRLADALKAVTSVAVKEARVRELRQELIKSEKLKRHFEENPADLQHLRHDGELRAARIQTHLRHVPEYLMPAGGKKALAASDIGFVGMRRDPRNENRIRRARLKNKGRGKPRKVDAKRSNPLQTFTAKRN